MEARCIGFLRYLRNYFEEALSVDTRALAVFRIGIAGIILADLIIRATDLRAHYTDFGVLPRHALIQEFGDPWHWSLHFLSGKVEIQALMFLIAGILAVMLLIGYRTKTATVLSWIMLVSLQNRNPMVLNGGDVVLRTLMFWAIFIPLGERYSIDSLKKEDYREKLISIGVLGLFLQIIFVLFFNGLMKKDGLWAEGKGLYYALSVEQFTTPIGNFLLQFPALMEILSVTDYIFLGILLASPLIILLKGKLRFLAVSLLILSQIGITLLMHVGLFPLIMIVAFLVFMPEFFWNRLQAEIADNIPRIEEMFRDLDYSGKKNAIPAKYTEVFKALVGILFIFLILGWNIQNTYNNDLVPDEAEKLLDVTRTDQYWNMFAPDPLKDDGWYVFPGELQDGTRIDVYNKKPINYSKPDDVSEIYPNQRWRKYMMNIWLRKNQEHREYLGKYLCREWNSKNQNKLKEFKMVFVKQLTRSGYREESTDRVTIWNHHCFR